MSGKRGYFNYLFSVDVGDEKCWFISQNYFL